MNGFHQSLIIFIYFEQLLQFNHIGWSTWNGMYAIKPITNYVLDLSALASLFSPIKNLNGYTESYDT
jgi:hypothetical protein